MNKLALFDLDHTLLPLDSDYEWGQFLVRTGAVDALAFKRANDDFFAQYQAGTLDPVEYLEFALGTLARFPRPELDAMHRQFMREVIAPAIGVEHLIAALPEEDAAGNLTGRLLGSPTSGAGKVAHTHAWLEKIGKPLSAFESSHFYSDSHNDIPLLSVVTHPVATNPNAALATHATSLGWPLLQLFND
jgi:phosphoserine phosphatase